MSSLAPSAYLSNHILFGLAESLHTLANDYDALCTAATAATAAGFSSAVEHTIVTFFANLPVSHECDVGVDTTADDALISYITITRELVADLEAISRVETSPDYSATALALYIDSDDECESLSTSSVRKPLCGRRVADAKAVRPFTRRTSL